MIQIHQIDKLNDFTAYFATEADCRSIDKLVYMLFLLDIMHFFEIGRPATDISYSFVVNTLDIAPDKKITLEVVINNDNVIFHEDNLTKREHRLMQKIVDEWDKKNQNDFIAHLLSEFNITTEDNLVSFKETLKNTDRKLFEQLKNNISDHDDMKRNYSKKTKEIGSMQCNQVKS